jgi:hypothetical protein
VRPAPGPRDDDGDGSMDTRNNGRGCSRDSRPHPKKPPHGSDRRHSFVLASVPLACCAAHIRAVVSLSSRRSYPNSDRPVRGVPRGGSSSTPGRPVPPRIDAGKYQMQLPLTGCGIVRGHWSRARQAPSPFIRARIEEAACLVLVSRISSIAGHHQRCALSWRLV